jgi:hypothetical protein
MQKYVNRVARKGLYQIIQSSVDVVYNLEEDTISLANSVLEGFILNNIDNVLSKEIGVLNDCLAPTGRLFDKVLAH